MSIHVLPVNDIKEHVEETTCPCEPEVIVVNGEMIIAHNAYDGRELLESDRETVSKKNKEE